MKPTNILPRGFTAKAVREYYDSLKKVKRCLALVDQSESELSASLTKSEDTQPGVEERLLHGRYDKHFMTGSLT